MSYATPIRPATDYWHHTVSTLRGLADRPAAAARELGGFLVAAAH